MFGYVTDNLVGNGDPKVRNLRKTLSGLAIWSTAGFSFHYNIYNYRDPRDKHWDSLWAIARSKMGASLPNPSGALCDILENDFPVRFQNWRQQAEARIQGLPATATDSNIRPVVKAIADDLPGIISSFPKALALVTGVAAAIAEHNQIKNEAIIEINHSSIISVEYSDVQQSAADVPTTISDANVSPPGTIPNHSNFNVIAGLYFVADSQFTLSAGTTVFNSLPTSNIDVSEITASRDSLIFHYPKSPTLVSRL